jgi:hypothetical protein
MVRALRSGAAIIADTGLSYRERREQVRLQKKRKKYEMEQAENAKVGVSGDAVRIATTRATTLEVQEMYTSIVGDNPPIASPSPAKKKRTRSGTVSCTDFGPLRHAHYNKPIPQFFFCGECDLWELDQNIVPKIQQCSRQYKCIAGHTNRIFPTTRLPSKSTRIQEPASCRRLVFHEEAPPNMVDLMEGESDDDSSSGIADLAELTEANATTSTTGEQSVLATIADLQNRNERLRAEKVKHQAAVLALKKTLVIKTRTIRHLKKKLDSKPVPDNTVTTDLEGGEFDKPCSPAVTSGRKNPQSQNAMFHEKVTSMLDQLVTTLKWKRKRVGKELGSLIFEYANSVCLETLVNKSKAWLRENVYTCYNILREMDRAGGTLGYEGIEIMRSVETKKVKWYKGSLIPSIAEFKRTAKKVEQLAHVLAPFILGRTTAGDKECINFVPYWKILGTIFRAFGLLGIGRLKSILCIFSLDGAKITKNLGHTMAGVKMTDRSLRCPFTGELLLSNPATSNAQSRSYVFPLYLMMGPETKESIKEVEPMFQFMEDCQSDDIEVNPMKKHYGLLPMTCGANSDLSAGWKCLCKGGAAKVSNLPCHCCALHKTKWAQGNSTEKMRDCAWCLEANDGVAPPNDWKCYHHRMMTDESLAQGRLELEQLTAALSGNLALIDEGTKMQLDDVDTVTPASDRNPRSIHHIPETAAERVQFGILLSDELILRDMSPLGTLTVKRDSLSKALVAEGKIRLLLTELAHGTASEGAMFLLIQAIPCILHLENRVGIKILTMLFIEGLSNAKEGKLYLDVPAEGPRIEMFFKRVATIVNKQVLGTANNSAEWQCATDDKMKEIGTIQMDNMRTRRIMAQLELLVEECIVDEPDKIKWLACIPKFRDGMIKLRSRADFDDTAIFSFQKDMDEFFHLWVELWGLEGCTNYIHMLSSGHLSVYLQKWKNLYRHSQQGWEAFNSLLKTFYFRRTQRGGSSNAGHGRKSRLLPIGRWLQRRVIWLCGYDGEHIDSWIKENPGAPRSGDIGVDDQDVEEEEDVLYEEVGNAGGQEEGYI